MAYKQRRLHASPLDSPKTGTEFIILDSSDDTCANEESGAESDVYERSVTVNGLCGRTSRTVFNASTTHRNNSGKTIFISDSEEVTNTKTTLSSKRPLFSVKFRDVDVARKYKRDVETFLRELISKENSTFSECDSSDVELEIWEDDNENNLNEYSFTVDNCPSFNDELDVPAYTQVINSVLQNDDPNSKKVKTPKASTCFNCMGSHTLRDCTEPRDHNAIRRNRIEFKNRHGPGTKVSRYHLEDEQRFAHFKPGVISSSLSKALGLSKHNLPRYIYQMRSLGYPPGWMEDAKISHSGIQLLDEHGNVVADPEDEEGEIVTEGSRDKYDIQKIISYPGFNVPATPGIKDEYEYYRSPPMTKKQSKETMISELQYSSATSYKKRKLAKKSSAAVAESSAPSDMDVEELGVCVPVLPDNDNCRFIPPLPKDAPQPPPPAPSESDSEGGEPSSPAPIGRSSVNSRPQSPSLSDLESKKEQLLAELDDGSSSDNNTSTPKFGKVKSVVYGTPLIKNTSPYAKLPSSEKFSKDICDVINFENLPDSTGKYEKMSGIIQKVRNVVASFQDDQNK